ncbi:hypothetical protein BJ878DRAFT_15293 [Calycina marina]|uniref:Homeobox domain-containing protein n=1 Tax=Calycina marina TaxID=1763456 RepID=A0A9P7Z4Z4_9HELO|nr:hypothetical protein BJ878DRAFT_15293 [Calycina marina]
MATRVVNLGQSELSNRMGDTRLNVTAMGAFILPTYYSELDDIELVEALASGNLWVTRGTACHVTIRITFNGSPIDEINHLRVLESLGYHCRDAYVWTQLSIATALDIPSYNTGSSSTFSLSLKDAPFSTSINRGLRTWNYDTVDIQPPDSVSLATFDRLILNLRYETISMVQVPAAKRRKDSLKMGRGAAPRPTTLLWEANGSQQLLKDHTISNDNRPRAEVSMDAIKPLQNIGRRHSPGVISRLRRWLEDNRGNPYPSSSQKNELMKQTGLQGRQITTWMYSERRKMTLGYPAVGASDQDVMLLDDDISSIDETYETVASLLDTSSAEMLLLNDSDSVSLEPDASRVSSQYENSSQSVFSHSGISNSSLLTQASTDSCQKLVQLKDRKRLSSTITADASPRPHVLDTAIAVSLMSTSLAVLLGSQLSVPNVSIETCGFLSSLSSLVPAIFSPGFAASMSHHARLLPGVSRTIAISCIRTGQGNSLTAQSLTPPQMQPTTSFTSNSETYDGSYRAIKSVIQCRVWKMMQQTLSHPYAGKTLRWSNTTATIDNDQPADDCDLFAECLEDNDSFSEFEDLLETNFMDEEEEKMLEMLFEEPSGNRDRWPDYFEDVERREIEAETEDMLFGEGSVFGLEEADEDELLLVDGYEDDESMLF